MVVRTGQTPLPYGRRQIPFYRVLLVAILGTTAAWTQKIRFDVQGEDFFSEKKVLASLGEAPAPEFWSEGNWQRWSELAEIDLADRYHSSGFFDADVVVRSAPGGPDSTDRFVQVYLREGQRYLFGQVSIEESIPTTVKIEPRDLNARKDRFFNEQDLFQDLQELREVYGDAGYVHAELEEERRLDTQAKQLNVIYRVDPSYPLIFDTLIIRNRRENDASEPGESELGYIRELLNLDKGDTVKLSRTNVFKRKLRSTGLFRTVRLSDSLHAETSESRALLLELEERTPGIVDFGLSYETQYGFGFSSELQHRNLNGRFNRMRLQSYMAQRRQDLTASMGSPLVFGTQFQFDNELNAIWRQDELPLSDRTPFQGNFQFDNTAKISRLWERFRYVSEAEILAAREVNPRINTWTGNYMNTLIYSLLDAPIIPTKGFRLALTWGNGGPLLVDEYAELWEGRHNWIEAQSSWYLPMLRQLRLALRLDAGRFFGEGGLNTRRFFLGGPRNVRSFDWRAVCGLENCYERAADGEPVYFDIEPAFWLASAEMRILLFDIPGFWGDGLQKRLRSLQIVPFVDYGRIWAWDQGYSPNGEALAFGLGMRYTLFSIFNLRIDHAWGLDGLGRETAPRWIFDLAQAF